MFLDSWINYLKPSNSSRITSLSIHDPFAIAGFVVLLLLIPVALVLLTVTARRSAESIWDGIRIDARFRILRRSTRMSRMNIDLAQHPIAGESHRSDRATVGTKRVSFMLPETPLTPKMPGISETPRTPRTLRTSRGPRDTAAFLANIPTLSPPADRPRISLISTPQQHDLPLPPQYEFTDVYERYIESQRPPRLHVALEDPESKRRWTSELQKELEMTAVQMV